jgi:hypothetical protein
LWNAAALLNPTGHQEPRSWVEWLVLGLKTIAGKEDQLDKVMLGVVLGFLATYYLQLELAMSRLAQLETGQRDRIPPRQIALGVGIFPLGLWVLELFRYVCVPSLVFFESFQLLSLLSGGYEAVSLHPLVHQGDLG